MTANAAIKLDDILSDIERMTPQNRGDLKKRLSDWVDSGVAVYSVFETGFDAWWSVSDNICQEVIDFWEVPQVTKILDLTK